MTLEGLLAVAGAGGLLLGGFWLLSHFERKRTEALDEAARALGLQERSPRLYQGQIEGLRVHLGEGQTVVAEGTPLTHLAVQVELKPSPGFDFRISQAGAWPMRQARIPDDPVFNRTCELQTPEPERLLRLLAAPELRRVIGDFIRKGRGCSSVNQHGTLFKVVDAHLAGSASILASARLSLEVARGLSAAASVDEPA